MSADPVDVFVLAVAVMIAVFDVTLWLSGGQTISGRVRVWTKRYPWLIVLYFAAVLVLAYHFWG